MIIQSCGDGQVDGVTLKQSHNLGGWQSVATLLSPRLAVTRVASVRWLDSVAPSTLSLGIWTFFGDYTTS